MITIPYLAGLIDGEGCITLFRYRKPECEDDILCYVAMLQVGMVHKPLIAELQSQFGGYIGHKKPKDAKRRAYSVWNVKGERCINLLKEIEPFLIAKKDEANLLIQYWSDKDARLSGGTMKGLKGEARESVKLKREWYRIRLQELKRYSFGPFWDGGEFGEQPMPGSEMNAEGQPRAKQTVLKAVGRV